MLYRTVPYSVVICMSLCVMVCVHCVLYVQKGETDGYHKEMEELRRKNCSLVKEVERLTMQAEKPLEQPSMSVSWFLVVDGVALPLYQTIIRKYLDEDELD